MVDIERLYSLSIGMPNAPDGLGREFRFQRLMLIWRVKIIDFLEFSLRRATSVFTISLSPLRVS